MGKSFLDWHKMVKTLGFSDEFHDICDPIIYGRTMKVVRYEIEKSGMIQK